MHNFSDIFIDIYWGFFKVVLTVSQLIWCRDVTEILEGDFDRLEGMKEFEQKCFKVLDFICLVLLFQIS